MSGETVIVLRAGEPTYDRNGNPIPGPDVEIPIDGCFVGASSQQETIRPGETQVITELTVYVPGKYPDVRVTDRVRVRDRVYAVDGEPFEWRSPWGSAVGGMQFSLRAVE